MTIGKAGLEIDVLQHDLPNDPTYMEAWVAGAYPTTSKFRVGGIVNGNPVGAYGAVSRIHMTILKEGRPVSEMITFDLMVPGLSAFAGAQLDVGVRYKVTVKGFFQNATPVAARIFATADD